MTKAAARKPVQARAEATKSRILDVARKHFAERGFEAANTRDIAREADASHAMIRYHFGNKDTLWREAVRDMYQNLWAEVGMGEDEADADKRLDLYSIEGFREYLRRYIYYAARHPEYARIVIAESVRGGERLRWMSEEFIRPAHKRYADPLRFHMENANLPKIWHISAVVMIAAVCQMPFVLSGEIGEIYGVDMSGGAAIEAHIDSVFALVFRDPSRFRQDWPKLPDWVNSRPES
jgi:AcrR family transcriptional regulator